jgi:hypothetical protein
MMGYLLVWGYVSVSLRRPFFFFSSPLFVGYLSFISFLSLPRNPQIGCSDSAAGRQAGRQAGEKERRREVKCVERRGKRMNV